MINCKKPSIKEKLDIGIAIILVIKETREIFPKYDAEIGRVPICAAIVFKRTTMIVKRNLFFLILSGTRLIKTSKNNAIEN